MFPYDNLSLITLPANEHGKYDMQRKGYKYMCME